MARKRSPKVAIKWESRTDEEGRRYAILRWTEDSTRKNRKLGYVTTEEAEQLRGDHEAALRLQVASPIDSASSPRVADVLALYTSDLDERPISEKYGAGETTRCATLHRLLGHLDAARVTSHTLSRYLGDRRREPNRHGRTPKRSSLLMEIDTLFRAYRCAIEQRVIPGPEPVMPTGKLPNDKRPHRRLTEAEVAKLIAAGHRDEHEGGPGGSRPRHGGLGWLIQTLAWSGRRPVAVLELEVADLARVLDPTLSRDEQLVLWRKDKGGEGLGWGPITESARDALVARAKEVGTGRLWQFPDCVSLSRPFQRTADRAGVASVQPYDLRRFAVTRILDGVGQNVKKARAFTGHLNDATLLRYAFAPEGSAESMASRIGWTPLREVEQPDTGEGS